MKKLSKSFEFDSETWDGLINKWVLSERERGMLHRFLIDARTIEQIAEEYERSVTQTKTILNKWQAVIFRHID